MTYALPPPPKPEAVRLRRWAFTGGGVALAVAVIGALINVPVWAFFVLGLGGMVTAGILLMAGSIAPQICDWWEKRHQPRSS